MGVGEIGGVSPGGGVTPPVGRIQKALQRAKKISPPNISISSISFPQVETLKMRAAQPLMLAKAMSVFAVKTLIKEKVITQMRPAMVGVGSLFLGLNVPIGILNVYSLVKNWSKDAWLERSLKATEIAGNLLLSAAGAAMLISKVPSLAKLAGMKAAMGAGKMVFILGPLGMALFSAVGLARGGVALKDALKLFKSGDTRGGLLASLDALRWLLLAVGIGVGAAVMAGIIGGALATPMGWLAVGLVGAGLVISIGLIAMKTTQQKKEVS